MKKLKDRDTAARARAFSAVARGGIPGGFLGALGGVSLILARDAQPVVILLGVLVGGAAISLLAYWIPEGMGAAAGRVMSPSGSSTPRRREYSYPQSLAARGRYREAVGAYLSAALDEIDDPEPFVQAARIARDHLGDSEEAAAYFREARGRAAADPARTRLIARELAELRARHPREPGSPSTPPASPRTPGQEAPPSNGGAGPGSPGPG